MYCRHPDRHEPGIECGYPLPCPFHTIVLDENIDKDERLNEKEKKRLHEIIEAIKEDEP